MCGIAGAVWTEQRLAVDAPTLQSMVGQLRHRGPDDEGHYRCDRTEVLSAQDVRGVALGHRRLAVIDVEGSREPMANEDETVWLVFNGEIYNYRTLRGRLEASGHSLCSEGDAETVLHLYEDEGLQFLQHLVGMFALALWDARRQQLILARDRLGQKPLVYRQEPGRLLFASELKSILAVPGVPREVDPGSLDEYLTLQYVPHPNTIFRGIRKLPPAHCAIYRREELQLRRYWTPDWNRETVSTAGEAAEMLRLELQRAVALRMQSDVPLGAFLSGGVDSSIIVALMQQVSQAPVKTFSIGFPFADYDETPYARHVAQYLGTDHQELRVEPQSVDMLPKLVWHYDEPFADSSALPTYYLARMTREHVTVALSGDGGDELFGGYSRYQAVRLASLIDRLPGPLRRLAAAALWQRIPARQVQKGLVRRLKRFSEALALPPDRRYGEWISIFGPARRAALYRDDFLASLPDSDPLDFLRTGFLAASRRDFLTRTLCTDLQTYLPCDLMTKVDIASMAHGLECRQPMLDHRVVELAIALPLTMKIRGRRGKWILRQAFGDLVPRAAFARPKMGFGVPIDHWFRDELHGFSREVLLDRDALARTYFQPAEIQRLLDEHLRGVFDHAYRLWALLVLELWMRQWLSPVARPE